MLIETVTQLDHCSVSAFLCLFLYLFVVCHADFTTDPEG